MVVVNPLYNMKIITETYKIAGLQIRELDKKESPKREHVHLYYNYDPLMNVATIVIDHYGRHFKHKFLLILSQLHAGHSLLLQLLQAVTGLHRYG